MLATRHKVRRVVIPALVWRHRSQIGGAAAYVNALERHLRSLGIEVLVLGCGPENGTGFRSIVPRDEALARHHTLALWRRRAAWSFPPHTVIHVQRPEHVLAFPAGAWPIVVTFHGRHMRTVRLRWGPLAASIYRRLERQACRRADALVFVSRTDQEQVASEHPPARVRSHFVPVGVDRERFHPVDRTAARRRLGLPEQVAAFGYVGRLVPEKNVASLVRAIELVPDAALWVAGGGRMENRLRRLAGPRVRFLGPIEPGAVPLFLSACDGLVLASVHEGLPTVVLEAWSCGRPVVAPPVGDLPSLLSDGGGILVPDRAPESLARGMGVLLRRRPSHETARREEEDRLRSRTEPYAWGAVCERILNVYAGALERHLRRHGERPPGRRDAAPE